MRRIFPLLFLALALPLPRGRARGGRDHGRARRPARPRGRSQSAAAPIRFNMLGLHWQGSGSVDYRTRSLAGRWSAWRDGRRRHRPRPRLGRAEPRPAGTTATSTGPAPRRTSSSARRAASRGCAPTTSGRSRDARAAADARRSPARPRSSRARSWEADEKITRAVPHYAPTLKLAIVHHTAGTNIVHAGAGGGDRARDRGLPREGERLERHRLQLSRRPLRHRLRGPRRAA